ncbi:hydroxypyruvate isomerase [Bordetella sp. BOR01]|uniref:hydroxypyruvate isomerase n=1 Tax=Bordetella sp. BOR01 TaxID=2854779 RepID=UPI001C46118F|nr:hydroxypyruvate isomerase [Bordetella sp. BOR01]MBV7485475.1 hydroxypyruvate isomerase [Bordetella sp. BOR01]
MPRFAANLTMLFTELPFMQRFEAAARAGFKAVEYLFPYACDKHELAHALRANGLEQVLHNLPAGDWEAGERGIACHPDRAAEFRVGVGHAIEYATALSCPQLNCLAGKLPPGVTAADARRTLVANLRFAAAALQEAGLGLLLEPVNDFDIPGFFVTRTREALSIIDEVGSSNVRLQYDIYHAQRMEGELGNTLAAHIGRIGHIQLADNPGRGEPGTGEIHYPWLFQHIDALGYQGWIGCEYKPQGHTEAGLGWRAIPAVHRDATGAIE